MHLQIEPVQMNPTSRRLVVTVVVGRATVEASKEAPQVIALAAVPVIAIQSVWPVVGVPDRFVENEVMSTV